MRTGVKFYKNMLSSVRYNKRVFAPDGYRAECVKKSLPRVYFVLAAIIAGLAVPLSVMLHIRKNTGTAEWWTRNIQRGWEKAIGTLTSWLPISILEFFIVCLVILGVYLFVRLFINLCRGKFRRVLLGALSLCVGAVYVLNLYVLSMGFAYYRAEMPIPQAGEKYTQEEATTAVLYFYEDYNRLAVKFPRDENGCVICPYTFSELAELLVKEYDRLDDPYFNEYTPKAKPIVNSWYLSSMLITGITFLPTGEANVNVAAPPTVCTITTAHELAHAKGVLREGDANLLARYILISSDNDYLRYCGYYAAFDNLMATFLLHEDFTGYNTVGAGLSTLIYKERRYAYDYWQSQPDLIGKIAEFFNNLYLKANGADNGTGSYNDGNNSDVVTPTDPETGEPERDPETDKPVRIINYSQVQKMFFAVYESKKIKTKNAAKFRRVFA